MLKEIFPGVFRTNNTLFTKNLIAGERIYGEELININTVEYRSWNPHRSKLAAAIMKGLKEFPVHKESKILYLGSAEGTTIGHLSDIIGTTGMIFGVDISAKVMQKFTYLCETRVNILPILADASKPQDYKEYISDFKIDLLYQDISQKEQAKIFIKNARMYLPHDKWGMLCIKARSIDSVAAPKEIINAELEKLEGMFEIKQTLYLEPYAKEHAFVLCRRK